MATSAGSYGFNGTGALLHQYASGPGTGETYGYDGAGRLLWPPPANMQQFSFTYWTAHDPEDPDDDPMTDDFGPEYYAQAILRATEYTEPPEDVGEWHERLCG